MKVQLKVLEIITLTVSTLACWAIFGIAGGDDLFKPDLSSWSLLPLQLLLSLPLLATVLVFKLGLEDFVSPLVDKEFVSPVLCLHSICIERRFSGAVLSKRNGADGVTSAANTISVLRGAEHR